MMVLHAVLVDEEAYVARQDQADPTKYPTKRRGETMTANCTAAR